MNRLLADCGSWWNWKTAVSRRFYYDWPVELGLISGGKVIKTWKSTGKLTGLLPGDQTRKWDDNLDKSGVPAGHRKLAIRVPNPLPKGNAGALSPTSRRTRISPAG